MDLSRPFRGASGATDKRASLINDNSYSKRIRNFVDSIRPVREPKRPSRGLIDVAFVSMQAMQDTIARLRLSGVLTGRDDRGSSKCMWLLRILACGGVDCARARACGAGICTG